MIRFRPRKSFTIRGRPGAAVAAGPGRRWRGCGLSRAGRGGRRALAEAGRGGARQRAEPRRARALRRPREPCRAGGRAAPAAPTAVSIRRECVGAASRTRPGRGATSPSSRRPRCVRCLRAGPASGSSPSVPGSFRDLRPCPPPSGALAVAVLRPAARAPRPPAASAAVTALRPARAPSRP